MTTRKFNLSMSPNAQFYRNDIERWSALAQPVADRPFWRRIVGWLLAPIVW